MSRKKKPSTMTPLLHVTREDGEITSVSKELVISGGDIEIFMNGKPVATVKKISMENVLWEKQPSSPKA